jgi:alpha-tubulin suppressor-like RCC1 family protein
MKIFMVSLILCLGCLLIEASANDQIVPKKKNHQDIKTGASGSITELDIAEVITAIPIASWNEVSAGQYHTLAVKNDKTLWSWGNNQYGQLGLGDLIDRNVPVQVGFDIDWFNIDGGGFHSLLLKTNGSLWACGNNQYGQLGLGDTTNRITPSRVGIHLDWVSIVAGFSHSLALKADGTLWSYGNNFYGQLGLGDLVDISIPTLITGQNWASFTAGDYHTLAIKTNGTLWAFGRNANGQLGIGYTLNRMIPTQVGTDINWMTVNAGGNHTLALKTDGSVWAWGNNNYGQLGIGDLTSRFIPVQMGTENNWDKISCGNYYTLARRISGSIWSFGQNNFGQLGLDDLSNRFIPVQIATTTNWATIATGGCHSFGIAKKGTLWSWGLNNYGQLGVGDSVNRVIPTQVNSINKPNPPSNLIVTLISSSPFRFYLFSQVDLKWIDNSNNESGFKIERKDDVNEVWITIGIVAPNSTYYSDTTGISTCTSYVYRVKAYNYFGDSAYSNEKEVVSAKHHSFMVKTNGTLWSWGGNDEGQLGLGNSGADTERTTPTQIVNESDWSSIVCGDYHTTGIKTDGSIWAWGKNDVGQLGLGDSGVFAKRLVPTRIGSTINWLSAMSSHGDHTIILKSNQTLWSWGKNTSGQLGLGDIENRNTPMMVGE